MTKIAFILSKFPCYDEAFILRELYGLSKQMDLLIFSLRKSKEKMVHDEAAELLPKTVYIPYFFSWEVLGAQISALLTHPIKYVKTFLQLVLGNAKSPEFLLKGLVFFPKSIYLARWLKKNQITHMHAYWATYPATVAFVASKLTGISFSFTGHAHDIYLDTTFLRRKMRRATFVNTCTRQNKDHLLKMLKPVPLPKVPGSTSQPENEPCTFGRGTKDKILVNYHGLDVAKFSVNGKKKNEPFEIISVGTLQEHKGFQYLIPALGLLRDRGIKFNCTIIGGGVLEGDIRKHIRLLELEGQVTMTGPVKQNEIIPYYKKADLLILMAQPEWHWGIPNVLIEALAAKTPVITTRFGSVEELVRDGETGLLVPPKDPKALADTIENLYRDDALRTRLAEAGHARVVSDFDLEKNIEVFRKRLESKN